MVVSLWQHTFDLVFSLFLLFFFSYSSFFNCVAKIVVLFVLVKAVEVINIYIYILCT